MDKETLSNYGWIVICVMVLAVMLAFASPFGNFVADAIKSTTQGLFDVNQNALDSANIHIMQQEFENMLSDKDPALNPTDVTITENKYEYGDYIYTAEVVGGNELGVATWQEGREVTKEMYSYLLGVTWDEVLVMIEEEGMTEEEFWAECGLTEETFVPPIFNYSVAINTNVTDKNQETYGPVLESINGDAVTNMQGTFSGCSNLKIAPTIPTTVTNLNSAFENCTSLTTAPTIPNSVIRMHSTFKGCTSLTSAPAIPSKVEYMASAFEGCTALVVAPDMSNAHGVKNMYTTFYNCTSLSTIQTIPANVENLYWTFRNCTSLTDLGHLTIPGSVTNMESTFAECANLRVAPNMRNANSVESMNYTFGRCTSLTTAPTIPNSVTNMSSTFYECTSLITAPAIPTGVTNMGATFYNCSSLTTAPDISNCSQLSDLGTTFSGCTSMKTYAGSTDADYDFSGYIIPNGVTDMGGTFQHCAFAYAPVIPNSVTDMSCTFAHCKSLILAPEIPSNVTDMAMTFLNCSALTTLPDNFTIPSTVTKISSTFSGCTALAGTIHINTTLITNADWSADNSCYGCFYGTTKEIIITGTNASILTLIAGTANNGNVSVE